MKKIKTWNIIKRDMNYIGPRPLTQEDITRLGWDKPFYSLRWHVKPGLTGLSQLSPVCHKKITWFLDKYYISNQSTKLNVQLFTLSLFVPLVGKRTVKSLIQNK